MNQTMDGDLEKTAIGVMDSDRTQMAVEPQSNATQYAANVDCPVCHTPNPPSETYCIDCGFMLASAPVAVEDMPKPESLGKLVTPDGLREFLLKPGANTVGRENADVLLAHNTVSRKHAIVTVADGKVIVTDPGSTNGTYVDGAKLAAGEQVELTDGCDVVFGSMSLKFVAPEKPADEAATPAEVTVQMTEDEPAEASETEPEAAEEAAAEPVAEADEEEPAQEPEAPAVVGRLVSPDGSLSFPLVAGVNTIGRRDGINMIVVPDPYCSGRHADLLVEDGTFTLTDIGSTNGTMVNGVKVEPNDPREVLPTDEITVGQTILKIEVA